MTSSQLLQNLPHHPNLQ